MLEPPPDEGGGQVSVLSADPIALLTRKMWSSVNSANLVSTAATPASSGPNAAFVLLTIDSIVL